MTFNEYQTKAHSTACHGGTLSYPIAALAEETAEVAAVWGNYQANQPSDKLPWTAVKVSLTDELGDVMWNVAELATLLKLDLDTEVADPAMKLVKNAARPAGEIVYELVTYVGKLNGIWAKYIRKHNGVQPTPDDAATNVRIGSEKDFGPAMRYELIAVMATLIEMLIRCDIKLIDVLDLNIAKLSERKQKNTLGGEGSVERK